MDLMFNLPENGISGLRKKVEDSDAGSVQASFKISSASRREEEEAKQQTNSINSPFSR
jgi:hypothetical protein